MLADVFAHPRSSISEIEHYYGSASATYPVVGTVTIPYALYVGYIALAARR